MRITRNCPQGQPNTGISACPIDFKYIVAAILVANGTKLPAALTAENLTSLCHDSLPNRVMPIKTFVEYAKNGGEAQASAVGYGPTQFTGLSQQTDTFSLAKYSPELHANLLKATNQVFGVYYVDKDNNIIGVNDGTDILAPIPVTLIPNATFFKTSSAQSVQTVGFAYVDTEYVHRNLDYFRADFDVPGALVGLVEVEIVATATTGKYKIIEHYGGYDRTAELGPSLVSDDEASFNNVTAATYNSADETLSLTVAADAVPTLKSPSYLFANNIAEGIIQYEP